MSTIEAGKSVLCGVGYRARRAKSELLKYVAAASVSAGASQSLGFRLRWSGSASVPI